MCANFLRKFMLATQRNRLQAADLVPEQAHQLHLFANPQIIFLIKHIYYYIYMIIYMYAWILCIYIYMLYVISYVWYIVSHMFKCDLPFPQKMSSPETSRLFSPGAAFSCALLRNGRGATTPGRARPLEPSWTSWASGPLEISMRKKKLKMWKIHR